MAATNSTVSAEEPNFQSKSGAAVTLSIPKTLKNRGFSENKHISLEEYVDNRDVKKEFRRDDMRTKYKLKYDEVEYAETQDYFTKSTYKLHRNIEAKPVLHDTLSEIIKHQYTVNEDINYNGIMYDDGIYEKKRDLGTDKHIYRPEYLIVGDFLRKLTQNDNSSHLFKPIYKGDTNSITNIQETDAINEIINEMRQEASSYSLSSNEHINQKKYKYFHNPLIQSKYVKRDNTNRKSAILKFTSKTELLKEAKYDFENDNIFAPKHIPNDTYSEEDSDQLRNVGSARDPNKPRGMNIPDYSSANNNSLNQNSIRDQDENSILNEYETDNNLTSEDASQKLFDADLLRFTNKPDLYEVEANIYKQDMTSYAPTGDFRKEETNYFQKENLVRVPTTGRMNERVILMPYTTEALTKGSEKIQQNYAQKGQTVAGLTNIGDIYKPGEAAKFLHGLYRFNIYKLQKETNVFSLKQQNYRKGLMLYGVPVGALLLAYLLLWYYVCYLCPRKLHVFKRCQMWKVKYYKKIMRITMRISILFGFIGIMAVLVTHGTICDVGKMRFNPIIKILESFFVQKSVLKQSLIYASKSIRPFKPFGNYYMDKVDTTINKTMEDLKQLSRIKELRTFKDTIEFIKKMMFYERLVFYTELLIWVSAPIGPIALTWAIGKYTFWRMKLVTFIRKLIIVFMVLVMLLSLFMCYALIGIADFCFIATKVLIELKPIKDMKADTLEYYLTCNNNDANNAAINITVNSKMAILKQNVENMFSYLEKAQKCQRELSSNGSRYAAFFDIEKRFNKPKLNGAQLILHFGIRAPSNGHVLLSSIRNPPITSNKVYEIAFGIATNRYTTIRHTVDRKGKKTVGTPSILSAHEDRYFYIIIYNNNTIEVGKEGFKWRTPIMWLDEKKLNTEIKYFSFAAYGKFKSNCSFDCPDPVVELPLIKAFNLRHVERSVKDLFKRALEISKCDITLRAYQELRSAFCRDTLEGIMLQSIVAGPFTGFFLTVMLTALCRWRAWQKALLCIHLMDVEEREATNLVSKKLKRPCKIFEKKPSESDAAEDQENSIDMIPHSLKKRVMGAVCEHLKLLNTKLSTKKKIIIAKRRQKLLEKKRNVN